MKKMLLPLLFLCASFAAAAPNPADYTETLHVTSSHLVFDYSHTNLVPSLQIDVVTNGKKYELVGAALAATVHVVGRFHAGVLPVGDYKAKLIRADYKPDYLLFLSYEILLPDGKTVKFDVIGESE